MLTRPVRIHQGWRNVDLKRHAEISRRHNRWPATKTSVGLKALMRSELNESLTDVAQMLDCSRRSSAAE